MNVHIKLKHKRWIIGILFVLPQLAGFVIFNLFPFVFSIKRAISNGTFQFVQLFSSSSFILALKNTFLFVLIGLPLLWGIVLLLALSMNRMYQKNMKLRGFFMALHLLPMVIPSAVTAFVLKMLFENHGLVNTILGQWGVGPINWLHSDVVFYIFIVLYLWKNYGYCMVIILGGIQRVTKETLEAAAIDGANQIKTLQKIVLPQMKNYTRFMFLMGLIGIFKIFRESYMLYGDYPEHSVYMIQNFMNNCYNSMNYSRLAAASVILIFGLSLLALILFAVNGRSKNERQK